MKNKSKRLIQDIFGESLVAITPHEMFRMIEDFADGLLHYIQDTGTVECQARDKELMTQTFHHMMKILDDHEIEGRLGIILFLQGACAMYQIACEQEKAACPNQLLN